MNSSMIPVDEDDHMGASTSEPDRYPAQFSMLAKKHISTRQPLLLLVLVWIITAFLLLSFFSPYQRVYAAKVTSLLPFIKAAGGGVTKSSTAICPMARSTLRATSCRCTALRSLVTSARGSSPSAGVLNPSCQRRSRSMLLSAA